MLKIVALIFNCKASPLQGVYFMCLSVCLSHSVCVLECGANILFWNKQKNKMKTRLSKKTGVREREREREENKNKND